MTLVVGSHDQQRPQIQQLFKFRPVCTQFKSMICSHCQSEFHNNEEAIPIGEDIDGKYEIKRRRCPNCNRLVLDLIQYKESTIAVGETWRTIRNFQNEISIRPKIELHRTILPEEKVLCCFCGETLIYKSALKISIELPGDNKELEGWFAHANCFEKTLHPKIPSHSR